MPITCDLSNFFLDLAIIPGKEEPQVGDQMNSVLRPLVDELKVLDEGITLCGLRIRVRAVLWSCDLPATRKAIGLLSHCANKGKSAEICYFADKIVGSVY